MIEFRRICDALAARFAPGTITTPAGALPMRRAYGQTPKNVAVVPCVIVEPQDGQIIPNSGQWEHTLKLDAVFLLGKRPGDPARVETQRQLWLPALWGATQSQIKLGIGAQAGYEVKSALPDGWEYTEEDVGGDSYDAIRVHYSVIVFETVSLTP